MLSRFSFYGEFRFFRPTHWTPCRSLGSLAEYRIFSTSTVAVTSPFALIVLRWPLLLFNGQGRVMRLRDSLLTLFLISDFFTKLKTSFVIQTSKILLLFPVEHRRSPEFYKISNSGISQDVIHLENLLEHSSEVWQEDVLVHSRT